jgi:hypothetical protein
MFGERTRPGQELLEHKVRHRRRHTLGYDSVEGRTPGLARERRQDPGYAKPQFPIVGRGREPAEQVIVTASGKA